MWFNSFEFAIFFPVVLILYYVLPHWWQNLFLWGASYVFYGFWDWRFLFLLLFSTVVDFFAARQIASSSQPAVRRVALCASLLCNLGVLAFFKYFNFFIDSTAELLQTFGLHPNLPALQIILPVGISFYTFQTLGYTIDVYRGKMSPSSNFINFALYVSYFPQLVAGPIERASNLLPKIQKRRTVSSQMIESGCVLVLMGYLKKVGIADNLAPYVDAAFNQPSGHSSFALLLSLYMFAIQIYCDFSGYSDIARGISRILGIELMLNFKQPYFSVDITEFWRRWHISLSTWLRDYLYIPLGGNRHGTLQTYRNLMITMLLGGLWHGAGWTFVIWGALHGLYLAAHKWMTRGRKRDLSASSESWNSWAAVLLQITITFHAVCFAWIFFRAPTLELAGQYIWRMFINGFTLSFGEDFWALAFLGGLWLAIDFGCRWQDRELPVSEKMPALLRGLAYAVAVCIISFVGKSEAVPFIYFQF